MADHEEPSEEKDKEEQNLDIEKAIRCYKSRQNASKKYYGKNKEYFIQKSIEYNKQHREKRAEQARARYKTYYEKNKDKINARRREKYKEDKEKNIPEDD